MPGQGYLRIPLLVMHRKESGYRLRCLFLPEIEATSTRYEAALNKLRQAVVEHFRNTRVSRATLDERLWLGFDPELRFELTPLGFDSGRRWVEGSFATAQFGVAGRRYACLPQLDGMVADLGEMHLDKDQRSERLVGAIQNWLRQQRKELGDAFDVQRYLAAPNDELGEIEMSLQLMQGRFPFEFEPELRDALRDDEIGDGPSEMARVAVDLNELYPDALEQAILCDDLLGQIHGAIYGGDTQSAGAGAIVLVGPRGAGKTALVHGALGRYLDAHKGRDRQRLQKIWHIDPMRVISGMSVIGQWQRRMAVLLQYLVSRLRQDFAINRPDHLYCDNLLALLTVGKSAQNTLTLADVLRPLLEKRAFTMIAEASPEAWQQVQQRDRRFADLFRVIRVDPPARATAIRIVNWRRARLERLHECRISSAAVAELLKMERRFCLDEVLPGSAIRVLDRLAVRHARGQVERGEVLAAYTAAFHFREKLFSRHAGLIPGEVAAHFAQRLIGQDQARAQLVDVVALIKSGLAAPGKPLASLMFIGPTGVGKSEAAKLLADYLFEGDGGLVRFDMNEYVDGDATARLIGDARRPNGQLTSAVRQRRACVLLLDEIEKAHGSVHDVLLQLLGEGRLTDAMGRTTDFSQCVVILTSNLGASAATRHTGFVQRQSDATSTYREAIERFFRPEFLNRIDQVVSFTALSPADIEAIARLQLERVLAREGFVRRLTFLNVAVPALAHLARLGQDEALGARALKRAIERALTQPIARRLAVSPNSQPMLLDVMLSEGALTTRATILEFARQRPVALPPDADSAIGCRQLSVVADALHESLLAQLDANPPENQALALRALQVRLYPLREVLARRSWEQQQRRASARTALKPNLSRPREWRESGGRPVIDVLQAYQDISEFFDQLYAAAQPMRAIDSELIRWQLELDQIQRRAESLARHGIQTVGVQIVSLQQGAGQAAVRAAWADYEALIAQLDLHEVASSRDDVRYFEGIGLSEAFAGECGIHLWYMGEDRPLPLAVRLAPANQDSADAPPTEIIRLRLEPARAGDPRALTDLRSGRVRKFSGALSQDDWRLLLWDARATQTESVGEGDADLAQGDRRP